MAASLGVASSAAHAARHAASVAPPRPAGLSEPGRARSLAPTPSSALAYAAASWERWGSGAHLVRGRGRVRAGARTW